MSKTPYPNFSSKIFWYIIKSNSSYLSSLGLKKAKVHKLFKKSKLWQLFFTPSFLTNLSLIIYLFEICFFFRWALRCISAKMKCGRMKAWTIPPSISSIQKKDILKTMSAANTVLSSSVSHLNPRLFLHFLSFICQYLPRPLVLCRHLVDAKKD